MNIHSYLVRKNRGEDRTVREFRAFPARVSAAVGDGIRPERRILDSKLELRASKSGKGPGLMVGYAAKFDKLSQDLGGFYEKLAIGCFDDVMGDDTCCLRNHEDDNLLGRTVSGTLTLSLDKVGLMYECELPDTTTGRDTAELVGRGDMRGSSFQFRIAVDGADWDFDGDSPLRTITRVSRLYDVAPVTNPAYLDTEVDMRDFQKALEARDALKAEQVLRSLSLARARLRLAEAPLF
jgi:HK97 family phage prohead protease